jgi:hypothetical protein
VVADGSTRTPAPLTDDEIAGRRPVSLERAAEHMGWSRKGIKAAAMANLITYYTITPGLRTARVFLPELPARLPAVDPWPLPKSGPSGVYFIQAESGGPIKIGHSDDPTLRLKSLQTAHPYRLVLLLSVPASTGTEAALHKRFATYRLRGEWFRPVRPLREMIRHWRSTSEGR